MKTNVPTAEQLREMITSALQSEDPQKTLETLFGSYEKAITGREQTRDADQKLRDLGFGGYLRKYARIVDDTTIDVILPVDLAKDHQVWQSVKKAAAQIEDRELITVRLFSEAAIFQNPVQHADPKRDIVLTEAEAGDHALYMAASKAARERGGLVLTDMPVDVDPALARYAETGGEHPFANHQAWLAAQKEQAPTPEPTVEDRLKVIIARQEEAK